MAVFKKHGFWLYFVSWLMFSVAGGIFDLIELDQSIAPPELGSVVLYVGVVLSALISGFASDHFRRKKTIIFGLITLGISYALFGIVTSQETFLLTRIIYGAAWGIILVVYMLTVIGDLASKSSKEKIYAIGLVVPLIVFMIFQTLAGALSLSIDISIISSILSVILFISVIPLLYAPETLPIDKLRASRLKRYLGKLEEVVKKEETNN